MLLCTITNGSGAGNKRLELSGGIEFSDCIYCPYRRTSNKENRKLGRVRKPKEKRDEDVGIVWRYVTMVSVVERSETRPADTYLVGRRQRWWGQA